jgi:hypothetical protein
MSTEENKIKQVDTIFDTAAAKADKIYGDGGVADQLVNSYQSSQNTLLDQQNEYLVSRLEQQKKQAEQSYTQEKSAAYTDYQKQVDPYGVQAEQMAQSGLTGSGYAESLKTQAYVAYQNRQAVAYQSYQQIIADYNNSFTEAKMQNDSQRASLAAQVMEMQLENLLAGMQYNYQLLTDKANARLTLATQYPEQYEEVLSQIYADYSSIENGTDDAGEAPEQGNEQTGTVAEATGNYGQVNSKMRANYILRSNGIDPTKLPAAEKILSPYSWATAKNGGKTGAEFEAKTYSQYANIALSKIIAKYKASGTANIENFV